MFKHIIRGVVTMQYYEHQMSRLEVLERFKQTEDLHEYTEQNIYNIKEYFLLSFCREIIIIFFTKFIRVNKCRQLERSGHKNV